MTKAIAAIALFLSLHGSPTALQPRNPVDPTPVRRARKGGRWYMAETGHAVYCFGPVRILPRPEGGLHLVATFCQGDQFMVPLME